MKVEVEVEIASVVLLVGACWMDRMGCVRNASSMQKVHVYFPNLRFVTSIRIEFYSIDGNGNIFTLRVIVRSLTVFVLLRSMVGCSFCIMNMHIYLCFY